MNEPTAAAVTFGLATKFDQERNVLVFDLGGGTFDVSILTIEDGIFEVKVTRGETHLGGRDFDLRVADYFRKQIKRVHGKDITSKEDFHRLSIVSEQEKLTLSSAESSDVAEQDFNLEITITRAKFVCLLVVKIKYLVLICQAIYAYSTLNDWSHGKQLILFLENLGVFRDRDEGKKN